MLYTSKKFVGASYFAPNTLRQDEPPNIGWLLLSSLNNSNVIKVMSNECQHIFFYVKN